MAKRGRGGRQWQAARAELKSRGDAYCWRGCGTYLLADAPQWHDQFMTMGHYLALEDGGSAYDPNNYGPECKKCNYSDGARRTNAKLGNPHTLRGSTTQPPTVDPHWYEAYQVGKPMALDLRLDPKIPRERKGMKLNQAQATQIRELRANKVRVADVARMFNISIGMVSHITNNNSWKVA